MTTRASIAATSAFRGPYAQTALVFQGGGALGAYQAGVYQALAEAGCAPDWLSGISIGAINAAIIAGNEPDMRLPRLRQFWKQSTSSFR
jgi:NTE family protein